MPMNRNMTDDELKAEFKKTASENPPEKPREKRKGGRNADKVPTGLGGLAYGIGEGVKQILSR